MFNTCSEHGTYFDLDYCPDCVEERREERYKKQFKNFGKYIIVTVFLLSAAYLCI